MKGLQQNLTRLLSDYGMFLALLVLCAFFSYITWDKQEPNGPGAAEDLAPRIVERYGSDARVLLAGRDNDQDRAFTGTLEQELENRGLEVAGVVNGSPVDVRRKMEEVAETGNPIATIVTNQNTSQWSVFEDLESRFPGLGDPELMIPESYYWPIFLKTNNLINVANQIVVIAILAIGMTMVIITGGIDLSVGSLIALSAVMCTLFIREWGGGQDAGAFVMLLCVLGALVASGALGAFSGTMVTLFDVPPFIVTLGMMLIARGLAYIFSEGQSVYQVPDSFTWLGREATVLGIPNAVVLMVTLYILAHILMSHTVVGRYIYAVGGNREAARLSGVPVRRILLFVYTAGGMLAGLGGVVTASQLKSGSPTYGVMYELYVIAAVVVGGTSLAGGEGKIFGTLIGAFIIAVIQNGMNLVGLENYTQQVVFGLVILAAVLLDTLKRRGFHLLKEVQTRLKKT